jgi:hypothetical protein
MPMRRTSALLEPSRERAIPPAVASQVAGRSGRTGLPRPPSLPGSRLTLMLFAGLRVRVTPVQRGRWKERRITGVIGNSAVRSAPRAGPMYGNAVFPPDPVESVIRW